MLHNRGMENTRAEQWGSFKKSTARHQLTIVHDDGVHRHLHMGELGTRNWSWDVITWPGHLATSGDVADGYVFAHQHDMLDLFDTASRHPVVDSFDENGRHSLIERPPWFDMDFWAEKVCGPARIRQWSPELFDAYVRETLFDPDLDATTTDVDVLLIDAADVRANEHEAVCWMDSHDLLFTDWVDVTLTALTLDFVRTCYAITATVNAYRKATR